MSRSYQPRSQKWAGRVWQLTDPDLPSSDSSPNYSFSRLPLAYLSGHCPFNACRHSCPDGAVVASAPFGTKDGHWAGPDWERGRLPAGSLPSRWTPLFARGGVALMGRPVILGQLQSGAVIDGIVRRSVTILIDPDSGKPFLPIYLC